MTGDDLPTESASPPHQARRSPSGCLIALFVLIGLGVLAIIGVGIAGYVMLQDPAVKDVVGAIGGVMNAPGRQELMDAGCEQAFVMDMDPLVKLAQRKGDEADRDLEAMKNAVMINCAFSKESAVGLDCGQVARIYREQVSAERQVHVVVQVTGKQHPECTGHYDRAGNRLGDALMRDHQP